jgi:hypothetical protein
MTADYKQLAQELYRVLNRFRCWSPEIDDVISKYEYATTRGTGRTTALYMKAITEALENPGKSVEFIDHYPHTFLSAKSHGSNLANIIIKLGYDIAVTVPSGDGRVFLYNKFGQ